MGKAKTPNIPVPPPPPPPKKLVLRERLTNCAKIHWKGFYLLITPLVLLPIIFLRPRVKCCTLYVIFWVVLWFAVDAAPVIATALIPIVAFPLLEVASSDFVCMTYFADANALFILCNFVAVTVQHSDIAKRFAFLILSQLGCNPKKLLLLLMICCYLLTTILPASFVCAFAMPTIRAMLETLDQIKVCKAVDESIKIQEDERPYPSKEATAFFIGTAFAINIGDISNALCSASSFSVRQKIKKDPSLYQMDGSFGLVYFFITLPVSLLLLGITILYLQIMYFGRELGGNFDEVAPKKALTGIAKDVPPFKIHMLCIIALYICALVSTIVVARRILEVNNKMRL